MQRRGDHETAVEEAPGRGVILLQSGRHVPGTAAAGKTLSPRLRVSGVPDDRHGERVGPHPDKIFAAKRLESRLSHLYSARLGDEE